ncbi:hypothetical protein SFRURICE_019709, partial [Spodoptera frugiperda]
ETPGCHHCEDHSVERKVAVSPARAEHRCVLRVKQRRRPLASRIGSSRPMNEDGFVVIKDFLTPSECDKMVAAGLDFTKNLPPKEQRNVFTTVDGEKKQMQDEYFLTSNDVIRCFFEDAAVGPDGELTVDPSISLNKVGHALHYQHPVFRYYTYCDRVKEVAKALGFKEPAVVQSMYIYKNPGIGGEVIPHQDITYLHTAPVAPVGFWIALEDATVENGCLWMVPGSHKSGIHRRLTRNSDKDSKELLIYDTPSPDYPESGFVPVPVTKVCMYICIIVWHALQPKRLDRLWLERCS